MLRIKKEIDLKELEKFGFIRSGSYYEKTDLGFYSEFEVGTYDKVIYLTQTEYGVDFGLLDTLYDLITAGYVEKVEE